jgi:hypothetical protein
MPRMQTGNTHEISESLPVSRMRAVTFAYPASVPAGNANP